MEESFGTVEQLVFAERSRVLAMTSLPLSGALTKPKLSRGIKFGRKELR